jgi:hypothetical protein
MSLNCPGCEKPIHHTTERCTNCGAVFKQSNVEKLAGLVYQILCGIVFFAILFGIMWAFRTK